jgi:hypothetical protein
MGSGELGSNWEVGEGTWVRANSHIECVLPALSTANIFSTKIVGAPYRIQVAVATSVTHDPVNPLLHHGDVRWGFVFGADEDHETGFILWVRLCSNSYLSCEALGGNCGSGNIIYAALYTYESFLAGDPSDPTTWVQIGENWTQYSKTGYLILNLCVYNNSIALSLKDASVSVSVPELRLDLPDVVLTNHFAGVYARTQTEGYSGEESDGGTISITAFTVDNCPGPDCIAPCECTDGIPTAVQVDISGVTGTGSGDWNGTYLCDVLHESSMYYGTDTDRCPAGNPFIRRHPCHLSYGGEPAGSRASGPTVYFGVFQETQEWPETPSPNKGCQAYSHTGVLVTVRQKAIYGSDSTYAWFDPNEQWDGTCGNLDLSASGWPGGFGCCVNIPTCGYSTLDFSNASIQITIPES